MTENNPTVLARLLQLAQASLKAAQETTERAQKAENEAWVVVNCLKVTLESAIEERRESDV